MYNQRSNLTDSEGIAFQQQQLQFHPHPQQYQTLPPQQLRQQQQTESYYNQEGAVIHQTHESPNKLVYQLHVDDQDIVEDDPLSCVLVSRKKDNTNPNQHQIGGVFVGNYNAALSPAMLQTHNIRAVLTVSKETPISYQPSLVPFHLQLDMTDSEDESLEKYLPQAIGFITNGRLFGNVLIQGQVGVSRSCAIMLAYLMISEKWTLEKALWVIRVKRSIANPNEGFMRQLLALEMRLFGRNTLVAETRQESNIPEFLQKVLRNSPQRVVRTRQVVNHNNQQEYIPLNQSYSVERVQQRQQNQSYSVDYHNNGDISFNNNPNQSQYQVSQQDITSSFSHNAYPGKNQPQLRSY